MTDGTVSLEETNQKVIELEKTVNDRRIYTRRPDLYPFDTVAGEMLAKAFALSKSAILLIQNGYPDEAFGLCRSLYECAIYLRYITQECGERHARSNRFLEFGVTSKAFWFDLLDKSSNITTDQRDDIVRYKSENQIPDDPKRMFQPWSGSSKLIEKISQAPHPIDPEDSTEDLRNKQRALAYTDTSCYVHCTQPGLNTYSPDYREPIRTEHRTSSTPTASKACLIIQVYLQEVVKYCFFGMGLDSLDELTKSALDVGLPRRGEL